MLLLLRSMVVIAVKPPKLPSFPPKFATFIFIEVILVPVHVMPCQSSPQGSPPFGIHPGSFGDPSETYSPFMAETSASWVSARARGGANAAAASRTSSTGARLIAAPDCSHHPTRRSARAEPPTNSLDRHPRHTFAREEPRPDRNRRAVAAQPRRSSWCAGEMGVAGGVGRAAAAAAGRSTQRKNGPWNTRRLVVKRQEERRCGALGETAGK